MAAKSQHKHPHTVTCYLGNGTHVAECYCNGLHCCVWQEHGSLYMLTVSCGYKNATIEVAPAHAHAWRLHAALGCHVLLLSAVQACDTSRSTIKVSTTLSEFSLGSKFASHGIWQHVAVQSFSYSHFGAQSRSTMTQTPGQSMP